MPIPFRATDDLDALGEAGFLKIDPCAVGPGYRGALLLVNARGEPIEFTYSRVETPFGALWRTGDARRFAARALVVSILSLCSRVPRLLLCLAEEVEGELFEREVRLEIPVCRVGGARVGVDAAGRVELGTPSPSGDSRWFPRPPPDSSEVARLVHELASRGLGTEPFDRASRGLTEVYGAADAAAAT